MPASEHGSPRLRRGSWAEVIRVGEILRRGTIGGALLPAATAAAGLELKREFVAAIA